MIALRRSVWGITVGHLDGHVFCDINPLTLINNQWKRSIVPQVTRKSRRLWRKGLIISPGRANIQVRDWFCGTAIQANLLQMAVAFVQHNCSQSRQNRQLRHEFLVVSGSEARRGSGGVVARQRSHSRSVLGIFIHSGLCYWSLR